VDDVNFEACVRFGVAFVVVVLDLQLQVNSFRIASLKNKFFLVWIMEVYVRKRCKL
jgi:hypothetical protein